MKDLQVIHVNALPGNTPAAVDMDKGILYLNDPILQGYNHKEVIAIVLHEMGHYYLDTDDELLSDQYAINALLKSGKPLDPLISALSKALGEDHVRVARAISKNLHHKAFNGDEKAMQTLFSGKFAAFNGASHNVMTVGQQYQAKQSSRINSFDPFVFGAVMNGVGSIANVFTSGRQAKAAERVAKENAQSAANSAAANLEAARLNADSLLKRSILSGQTTKTIIYGMIGVVAIAAIAFVIVKARRAK